MDRHVLVQLLLFKTFVCDMVSPGSLNPWSSYKVASTKEFWRSVTVPRLKKANPKCVINYVVHNKDVPPAISIK